MKIDEMMYSVICFDFNVSFMQLYFKFQVTYYLESNNYIY